MTDIAAIFRSIGERLDLDFRQESAQIGHRGSRGRVREETLVEQFLAKRLSQVASSLRRFVQTKCSRRLDLPIASRNGNVELRATMLGRDGWAQGHYVR